MDLRLDATFHDLIVRSYQRFMRRSRVPHGLNAEASVRWLYLNAPFAVLAHNSASDTFLSTEAKQRNGSLNISGTNHWAALAFICRSIRTWGTPTVSGMRGARWFCYRIF